MSRLKTITISLVRHGKTAGNIRGAFMGSTDLPLDPLGREGLAALPAALPVVEAVFASPMKRCAETAVILYPEHIPVLAEDLRERSFGEFEGKTYEEIIRIPGYEHWGMDAESTVFPGGESNDAFFHRTSGVLHKIALQCENQGCKAISLVTHGGVIMALMEQFCPPRRNFFEWHCPNGGGYHILWDGETITLLGRLGR